MRSWLATSAIGRNRANDRRSPLTEYWRAGKVTFRPLPPRRSDGEPDQPQPGERAVVEVEFRLRQFFPAGFRCRSA
ncbi:MAG: hypothetical protein DMF90_19335 [Acidobacteria bacterium]|nr:MAG: hypothetical protein DMF90_19335 [Acidobacteriota bacterium]